MKEKLLTFLLGQRLKDSDLGEEKYSVLWGIPVFASDAISSVSYAGEEILLVLIPFFGMMSFAKFLPIVAAIICLLGLLVFCYFQTIQAYPSGGGAYIVSHENLGELPGIIAGSSLTMDYILTVAVSSCAGAAAITSAFPGLFRYKALIAFFIITILTWGNLRGIRESAVLFGTPTYIFIFTMLALIITGLVKYLSGNYTPTEQVIVTQNLNDTATFIILKAFASGCTALTGVEAVSNGVPNFKEPAPHNAKKVLFAMAFFVCIIFLGVSTLISFYKIVPNDSETAISQLAASVFGQGSIMYFVVQFMTVIILSLAANTAYADLPLLMNIIAKDGYLPRNLANRGTRLSFSNGIIFLYVFAGVLVFVFNGNQHHLLPLYASGVFISFFLSQCGMFFHWKRVKGDKWKLKAIINGFGMLITGSVLILIVIMKFTSGAWITFICIFVFLSIMRKIKKHYTKVADELRVDSLKEAKEIFNIPSNEKIIVPVQSISKTSLKTLDYARSFGWDKIELINITANEDTALKLKQELLDLGITAKFNYQVTEYRNINELLLKYVEKTAKNLEKGQKLTVIMGAVVVTSLTGRVLHNNTTQKLRLKMEMNPKVSVLTVPYVLE